MAVVRFNNDGTVVQVQPDVQTPPTIPVEPTSNSSMATMQSSSSVSPGVNPPEKSSSTAPAPRPAQTQQSAQVQTKPSQARQPAQPVKQVGAFVPKQQPGTPVEAPVQQSAFDPEEEREGLRSLAVGTAQSTVASAQPHQQKYQTVFNWLTRRDPTITPWTDFVLHGPRTSVAQSNQSDMEAAQLEQQILAQQQRAAMAQGMLTTPMQRERQRMQRQWDELLADWRRGAYSGTEYTEQAFYDEANRLLGNMKAAGMDTSTLRMPSIDAGGFSQGFNKNLSEPLNNLHELDTTMGKIYEKAINNPEWLNSAEANTLFDKLGERVILDLGKSKGAIADAEKVRIQVEMMTPEVRDMYDNIMAKFFSDNNSLMAVAQQYGIDLSNRKTLDDLAKDLGGEKYTTDDKSKNPLFEQNFVKKLTPGTKEHTNFMKGVMDVFGAIKKVGGNIPPDLNAAVQAMQKGIEAFREYVMQDAPVNQQLIWDLAQRSRQENIGKFNDWAQKAGKNFGWKYRTAFNPDEGFGQWLHDWQRANGKWRDSKIYKMNMTTGAQMPSGQAFAGKGKVNNGR